MAGKYAHAEFVGLDQLMQKLDNVSGELVMSASRKGLEKTMTKMRDDARRNAPYGEGADHVHLRDSIHYTTKRIASHVRGELVASSEHAIFVEMGTGPKGEAGVGGANVSPKIRQNVTYSSEGWVYPTGKTNDKGKPGFVYTEGMPPRPYLYPAYKAHERQVHEDVRAEIYKAIREEGLGE